jgi:hypothetical protein
MLVSDSFASMMSAAAYWIGAPQLVEKYSAPVTPTSIYSFAYNPPSIPSIFDATLWTAEKSYGSAFETAAYSPPSIPTAEPLPVAPAPTAPVTTADIRTLSKAISASEMAAQTVESVETAIAKAQDDNNIMYAGKITAPGAVQVQPVDNESFYAAAALKTPEASYWIGTIPQVEKLTATLDKKLTEAREKAASAYDPTKAAVEDWVTDGIVGVIGQLYVGNDEQKATIIAQQTDVATAIATTALRLSQDESIPVEERTSWANIVKTSGLNYDQLVAVSPEVQKAAIYSSIGNKLIDSTGMADKFLAVGLTGKIYSLGELDKTTLSILSQQEYFKNYDKLLSTTNMYDELSRRLTDKFGTQLSPDKIDRICALYPSVAASMLLGKASVADVNAWFGLMDQAIVPAGLPGLDYWTNHKQWANILVQAKSWGVSDNDAYAILQSIRARADDKMKADLDSWAHSEWFAKDQDTAGLLLMKTENWMKLAADPSMLSKVALGTVVMGATAGLLVAGPPGAIAGGLMGVFPATEVPQNIYQGVFALKQLGMLDPTLASQLEAQAKAFDTADRDLQTKYRTLVSRGMLDEARDIAVKGMQLNDEIAGWVYDNMPAFVSSGMYDEMKGKTQYGFSTWESSLIGGGVETAKGSMVVPLPTGFDPGKDTVILNGTKINGLTSNALSLPQGQYTIEVQMGTKAPQSINVNVLEGETMPAKSFEELYLAGFTQPNAAVQPAQVMPVDWNKSEEDVRKEQLIANSQLFASMIVEPGWKYKDPVTGEWTDSDKMQILGYNVQYVEVVDPDGYRHYTSVNPTAAGMTFSVGINSGLPFVSGILGKPEVIENAIEKIAGEGNGILRSDKLLCSDKVTIDGQERMATLPWVVPEGTGHVITVQRAGYEPVTKTFDIQAGYFYAVSLEPTTIAREPTMVEVQYGPNKGLITVEPYYYAGQQYWLQGKEVKPGDQLVVDRGAVTIITTVPGFLPESRTINVDSGDSIVVGITPSRTIPSGGRGGGGGGGGGGGSKVRAATPTTISFGPNLTGCTLKLDGTVISPEIGKQYSIQAGYHTVEVYCTDTGKGLTKQVYVIGGQNLYYNPVLVPVGPAKKLYMTIPAAVINQEVTLTVTDGLDPVKGAVIKIDGEEVGATDSKGKFSFTPEETGTASVAADLNGYDGVVGTLTVTEEENGEEKVYYVAVSSEPEGAKVLINGIFIGEWSPTKFALKKGLYTLGLYKSGYLVYETPIWVADDPATGDEALIRGHSEGY